MSGLLEPKYFTGYERGRAKESIKAWDGYFQRMPHISEEYPWRDLYMIGSYALYLETELELALERERNKTIWQIVKRFFSRSLKSPPK